MHQLCYVSTGLMAPQDPKFEVENVQLLTIILPENFLSVELFLDIGSTRSEGGGGGGGGGRGRLTDKLITTRII
jgi:hypothetical protein